MDYIEGANRDQSFLFPGSLDEYVGEGNPVRFIDAFVESLALRALGFSHSVLNETGRPPYHPGALLRLYVYGTLNRLRSSRALEREAGRNVEVMWLTGKLAPDFKTIAYAPQNDCYRCPAAQRLTFRWQSIVKGRERRYYTAPAAPAAPSISDAHASLGAAGSAAGPMRMYWMRCSTRSGLARKR